MTAFRGIVAGFAAMFAVMAPLSACVPHTHPRQIGTSARTSTAAPQDQPLGKFQRLPQDCRHFDVEDTYRTILGPLYQAPDSDEPLQVTRTEDYGKSSSDHPWKSYEALGCRVTFKTNLTDESVTHAKDDPLRRDLTVLFCLEKQFAGRDRHERGCDHWDMEFGVPEEPKDRRNETSLAIGDTSRIFEQWEGDIFQRCFVVARVDNLVVITTAYGLDSTGSAAQGQQYDHRSDEFLRHLRQDTITLATAAVDKANRSPELQRK